MESRRMALEVTEKEMMEVADANFIMLSLYRDYANLAQKHPEEKEEYFTKMHQIKQDIRLLDREDLLLKVKKFYLPLFKNRKNIK